MAKGAAALAGTSFPIDRDQTAKALGFDDPERIVSIDVGCSEIQFMRGLN